MVKGNRILGTVGTAWIVLLLLAATAVGFEEQKQEVPVVDGHLGGCTADFTVKDVDEVPVYNAKIDVTLRYGFLGLRKLSLQVGTNSDGRARVEGLPDDSDKTYRFEISKGPLYETILMKTADGCKAEFEITLNGK